MLQYFKKNPILLYVLIIVIVVAVLGAIGLAVFLYLKNKDVSKGDDKPNDVIPPINDEEGEPKPDIDV